MGPTYKDIYEAAVESAALGIISIDSAGVILTANAAAERIFGHGRAGLMGRDLSVLIPDIGGEAGRRDMSQAIGAEREVTGLRKGGDTFPVELSVSEAETERGTLFTVFLRDLTPRKLAEASIRHGSALFDAVVETAVDGIITIDERGTILTANPAVERIFGYRPPELIGRNVHVLMPSPYHEEHGRYLANYLETRHRKIIGIGREVSGLRRDGSTFPLDLAVSETLTPDGLIFTGIVRDLTERVRAAEMSLAKEAAERANAAKSEFLSRMSHELRTPLNAVLGFAQLLDMRYQDRDIQQAAFSILKAGKHLLTLINEVLDLSGIEAGKLAISLEPIQLAPVVEHAVELLRPLAKAGDITLQMDLRTEPGCLVLADKQRLLQVIINLLANAIKYNRPGGTAIVVCEAPDEEFVRMEFRDTGPGIAAENQSKLFQPFERLGNDSVEGTGLGLVLSRRFVELMHGSIVLAESGPDGSVFTVNLHSAQVSASEAVVRTSELAEGMSDQARGNILYIEDNLSNLKLLEMTLALWPGIQLTSATHGLGGLELAASLHPDVILLDLHLPDIPGSEVLERLRRNPATSSIPVVVISADATPAQVGRLRRAGAYDYLTKPVDINGLLRVLEQLLPTRTPSAP